MFTVFYSVHLYFTPTAAVGVNDKVLSPHYPHDALPLRTKLAQSPLAVNMHLVSRLRYANHCSATVKLAPLMRPELCDLHRPSGFPAPAMTKTI